MISCLLAHFGWIESRNSGHRNPLFGCREFDGLEKHRSVARFPTAGISTAIVRIPPFHGGGHREIVRRPRVYAFDTGLVAHVRGWESIREGDRGLLWENLVLDELRAIRSPSAIHYWRDKSQSEIDFVIESSAGVVDAMEAKINPDAFEPDALAAFRQLYPHGKNWLVCPFVNKSYVLRKRGLVLEVCSTSHFTPANKRRGDLEQK